MTDPAQQLAIAEAASAAARRQATASFADLQAKLNPKRIARRAAHDVAEAGTTAAEVGVDVARRYPLALTGAVAVAGLLLARHRISHLFRRNRRSTRLGEQS